MAHRCPIDLWLLPIALGLGGTAALSPPVLGSVVAMCGLIAGGIFVALQPQKALTPAFFLVMLAETKFRMRDPAALLAGDVDSQIVFELFLYGIIVFVVVMNFLSSAFRSAKLTLVEYALFGYIILALLSSFWATDFRMTAVRSVQLCILYALCFVGIRVLGPQGMLRTLTASMVCYVLLFALLAVVFPWADGTRFTQTTRIPRFTWFALHPIVTAAYAGTAALFLAAEGLFAPGAWRRRLVGLPLWLLLTPPVLVLIATYARGALIAFIVTLVVLGLRRYVNPWVAGLVSYGVLVLAAMSLGLGFLTSSTQQVLGEGTPLMTFFSRGQPVDELLSLNGRTELWQQVYALFLERPLIGYGYIASRSMLLKVLPWAGEAHNALAETLLDVGVIGTVLVWFAFISALLSSLLHTLRMSGIGGWQHASIFGALLFLLVHSLVTATFAGAPGSQVILLFTTVLAHDRLKRVVWPLAGTLDTGAWLPSSAPLYALEALMRWTWQKRPVSEAQKAL